MSEFFILAPMLLLAVLLGYLLGSLPTAKLISSKLGVDIFETGTGLPGAANVLRSVGKVPAGFVLLGDMGKGTLAILAAIYIGIETTWLLLPAFAVVLGHWFPIFARFRGGDGLATIGGATIALFPVVGTISVVVGMVVALGGQRLPYSSLLSIVFCYGTLIPLNMAYGGDTLMAVGLGGIASLVLAHALLGHRRRRDMSRWDNLLIDEIVISERSSST